MSPIMTALVVAAALAFGVLIYFLIRVLSKAERTMEEASVAISKLEGLLYEASQNAAEVRKMIATLQDVSLRAQSTARGFQILGGRVAAVSSAVLDEVEPPVRTILWVANLIRHGIGSLVHRWAGSARSIRDTPI